jgi:hypothetical protein
VRKDNDTMLRACSLHAIRTNLAITIASRPFPRAREGAFGERLADAAVMRRSTRAG